MKTLQTTTETLTIHTTLFDMIADMQDEAVENDVNIHTTDAHIVSTVAEWMRVGRITSHDVAPILSAA